MHYVPPVIVDVVWIGLDSVRDEALAVAVGIFEMLHRRLGVERDQRGLPVSPFRFDESDYWRAFAATREVDVPVFIGRDFRAIGRDLEPLQHEDGDELRVVIAIWPGDAGALDQGRVADFRGEIEKLEHRGALVLEVPLHASWLGVVPEDHLPVREPLYSRGEDPPSPKMVEEGIAIELVHRLAERSGASRLRVLVSRAPADDASTDGLATRIREYLTHRSRLQTFFDARMVEREPERREQMMREIPDSLLLCVAGDHFADDPLCQMDVLAAKEHRSPVITVSALHNGEVRSLAFGGNHYRLPWNKADASLMDRIARLCIRTQLRHLHFDRVAEAVQRSTGLTGQPSVISRPPEPVDLATEVMGGDASVTVLYPDPPMGREEAALLLRANPRSRLVTPSTLLSREVIAPEADVGTTDMPLKSLRIGFSMSNALVDAPPLDQAPASTGTGMFKCHLDEAIAHAALTAVRLGGGIGYGGHLGKGGYTELLVQLMARHNRITAQRDQIYSYLVPATAALVRPEDTVADVRRVELDVKPFPVVDSPVQIAWQCTQMRKFMAYHKADASIRDPLELRRSRARECHARVVVGGTARPKERPGEPGYSGPFPGAVEEAWWTVASPGLVENPKPLYVLGGFGGVAADLARCLDPDAPMPERLQSATWSGNARYVQLARDYQDEAQRWDARAVAAGSARWEAPGSLDLMAEQLRDYGRRLRAGEVSNGLTWEENQRLWTTTAPSEAATLLAKGLIRWQRSLVAHDRLRVTVHRGNALQEEAEAIGIATLEGLELSQVDGLDRMVLSAAGVTHDDALVVPKRGRAESFGLPTRLAARHAVWASLGSADDLAQDGGSRLVEAVRSAASDLVAHALASHYHSLVLVPLGANLNLPAGQSTRAIVEGALAAQRRDPGNRRLARLSICEIDPSRYRDVLSCLEELAGPAGPITLEERLAQPGALDQDIPLVLRMTGSDDGRMDFELDLPGTAAPVTVSSQEVDWDAVDEVLDQARLTPFRDLAQLGQRLREAVFPRSLHEVLSRGARPIEVRHDGAGGAIPVELAQFPETARPADRFAWLAMRGVSRRPVELVTSPQLARTAVKPGIMRVLLVIDPEQNLPGTRREQKALATMLNKRYRLEIKVLDGASATRSAVLEQLRSGFGVLHYAGHAWLDEENPRASGLRLADGPLRSEDFRELPPGTVPPVVFLNACESVRTVWLLRSGSASGEAGPATVAEQLLAAGVRNLVGTLWNVKDRAAALFAETVYDQLLKGRSIGAALYEGRLRLMNEHQGDAFNYVLYGGRELKLTRG